MKTLAEYRNVKYSKGQMRIQQMAFVLVALMIFFAMAAVFYFAVRFSMLEESSENLREQEAIETVRKMSGSPEFAWTSGGSCAACVDFDKVLALKNRTSYQGFWRNVALLRVERIYPDFGGGVECTLQNYPNCDKITIIDEKTNLRGHKAFVSLCRYEAVGGYNRCDLGKIVIAFESVG
jgi:hypothetical protein